jgi:hypothetical protein
MPWLVLLCGAVIEQSGADIAHMPNENEILKLEVLHHLHSSGGFRACAPCIFAMRGSNNTGG